MSVLNIYVFTYIQIYSLDNPDIELFSSLLITVVGSGVENRLRRVAMEFSVRLLNFQNKTNFSSLSAIGGRIHQSSVKFC